MRAKAAGAAGLERQAPHFGAAPECRSPMHHPCPAHAARTGDAGLLVETIAWAIFEGEFQNYLYWSLSSPKQML